MGRQPGRVERFPDCTGVLVAGGTASRLGGIPKGLLRIEGEPIAARSLRLFDELFAGSIVVANDAATYARFGVPVVPDAIAGKGAPGGLHAALRASRTRWVFTAACDMPFLAADPIAWLAERRERASAVVVMWKGRVEPLHAFWSCDCLATIEAMLHRADPSMWQIATAVGARIVPEDAWREIDPDGNAFANINTPDDARRAGALLGCDIDVAD